MTGDAYPIPPYDPELLAQFVNQLPGDIDESSLGAIRAAIDITVDAIAPLLEHYGLEHEEHIVDGPRGDLTLSVVKPADAQGHLAAIYDIHGGGMIMGNRFGSFLEETLGWAAKHRLALISPEYGLAPEFPAPQGALDCFTGLKWAFDNAHELGIDTSRVILAGESGGGGLAASVALLARDKGGPTVLAQMLRSPQLEDRHNTVSSMQFSTANGATDLWPRETNQFAWRAILGDGHADRDVDAYSSPARATTLAGLPPTFIDGGGNEVFRDALVSFASRLWASGVSTELHVWPGAFHGFDVIVPTAAVSQSAHRARDEWLTRTLAR